MLERVRRGPQAGRTVYRCGRYPILVAGVFAFIALVGLSGIAADATVGGKVFGGVLAGVGLFFAARAARAGAVVTAEDSLVIRNLVRTHRVPYREIRAVTAETRPVGPVGYRRSCLVLESNNGRRKVFTEFNSVPGKHGRRAVVELIADELDSFVRTAAKA